VLTDCEIVATVISPLLDDLGPLTSRNPLHEQYQHIVNIGHKMRELVGKIPSFLLRENTKEPERYPWLEIARRSLAITAADKVCFLLDFISEYLCIRTHVPTHR
jgi:hypothetical protein